MQQLGKHFSAGLIITLSAVFYVGLSYFTVRTNAYQVLAFIALLFAGYAVALRIRSFPLTGWLVAAVAFRLICLGAFPNLSDDLYRFLWDGQLWIHGESPFIRLPEYHAMAGFPVEGAGADLYAPMNSKSYFTIYPPICQFIFAAAAWIFPSSIFGGTFVMKLFLVAAELGNIWIILKILRWFGRSEREVLWYALNPLIIFEFSGNAHFEAIMIFFLLGALYLLMTGKWKLSAGVLALSICTKLLPLMFLPFLIKRLGWGRAIAYGAIVGFTCILLFVPFLSFDMLLNIKDSFSLYFERFEFNASVFYLIRSAGMAIWNFDVIRFAGWSLSLIVLSSILIIALLEKDTSWNQLPVKMLVALTVYFGLATIVHPWYVATLVALSTFTKWRYAMVWSATVTLSYYTYRDTTYTESYWLIGIEYGAVFTWLMVEIWRNRLKGKEKEILESSTKPVGLNG